MAGNVQGLMWHNAALETSAPNRGLQQRPSAGTHGLGKSEYTIGVN